LAGLYFQIGAAASLLVSPNIGNPDSAIMATQTLKVVLPHDDFHNYLRVAN